ncbi:MAG: hypothetical protein LQ343_005660 [Gyalolechia ehrenbergii]|nr:MAG: hypothetical protein LQ343_005660 [Gyalolechia ehrenbergii]
MSFRYSTLAVLFVTVGYLISFFLVTVFQCNPPKKFWDPLVPGKCINSNAFYLAVPIVNMLIDISTLLLPIPMVVNLHVNMRTKLVLGGIFAVSGCTVVISAVRVWTIQKIIGSTDRTWNAYTSTCVMIVGLNMTVFCACIMVLRPFCRRLLPFLLCGRNSGPADDRIPDADAILKFDGPSGPRSKSKYATQVSAGSRAPKKLGKRNLWPGLGSTLVKEDDDDMESLSQELSVIAPHVHSVNGARGNHGAAGTRTTRRAGKRLEAPQPKPATRIRHWEKETSSTAL